MDGKKRGRAVVDRLLHELGQLEEGIVDPSPSDETLEAYRAGLLDEEQARGLEVGLGRDEAARGRLAKLAGLSKPFPAPWVRSATLAAFRDAATGVEGGLAEGSGPDRKNAWRRGEDARHRTGNRWRRWAAAAALAAGLATALVWTSRGPEPLPSGLTYEVQAFGLAATRSAATTSAEIRALPETRVRLVVTPTDVAEKRIAFALYVHRNEHLERLPPGAGLELRLDRGSAVFEARAEDLVGRSTGEHALFIVVARPNDLPASGLETSDRDAGALLADGGRRLVYRRSIHLLDELR